MNGPIENDRRKMLSTLAIALAGVTISSKQAIAQELSPQKKKQKSNSAAVSTKNTPSRVWGKGCKTWELLANPELSVFYEKVSPGTKEVNHYHVNARQFFFVLKGQLTIQLSSEKIIVNELEGFEVDPGVPHQAINNSDGDIEFLAISSPITKGDRVTV